MNEGRTVFAQLLVLAFEQLTWRESLRDIETCLASFGLKLYHAGIRQPTARNTLAVPNENRDCRIFADFAHVRSQQSAALALDPTTIDLCLPLFP